MSFLVESRVFGKTVRSDAKLTNTEALRDGIGKNLDALDQSDPMVSAARRKLALLR